MDHGATERDLATALKDTLALLDSVAETLWASKIRRALEGSLDPTQILSWYGGMGSFNDLVVAKVNGHELPRAHESVANARLAELRTEVYELAVRLNG
jgi:hypothetical protein